MFVVYMTYVSVDCGIRKKRAKNGLRTKQMKDTIAK